MNIVVVQPDSGTRPAEPRFTDDLLEVARTLGVVETTVADAFEDAAAAWVPGEDVPFIVRRFAHPDSWASLLERWEEYVERCRLRDGLSTGAVSWQEVEPDLTCGDRQETAFQMAAGDADVARSAIQFGGN